ncbi:SDR family oxidoreductase [Corticibacter populi]|uniref:SDR family oxidoreductase n=1 Tax=Corticibacter populi TaxID=1550736 RepID=A0A3M6QRM7_9BURK|nr:SDR family oxidoreductase [Corticibacter populi]RMX05694.1 SDR family oxidoreductase [Corticibacter populi]RZS31016.1 NAD(P)-dependent dehydrogenase (short-subunit alcohol dehydrogenase family) [Corticibacter populi]
MSEANISSLTLPFAGRVAIVTGAASGIGLATVELLHRQGARIVAVGRGDNVNALAREGVVPVVADVAQEASAALAVKTAIEQFGRLDILVNNAGIIINRPVAEMSLEEWNQVLAVNATGAFLFSRAAMRPMMAAGSGAIVNIGSYACYQSFAGIAAYAASKGALAQLTRTLALEAISHGIRVNAVGSGDAVTNITNAIQSDGQAYLAEHGRKAPIGRAARPEEIAQVAAFLASDQASYIVGAVVMADGGMSVAIQ